MALFCISFILKSILNPLELWRPVILLWHQWCVLHRPLVVICSSCASRWEHSSFSTVEEREQMTRFLSSHLTVCLMPVCVCMCVSLSGLLGDGQKRQQRFSSDIGKSCPVLGTRPCFWGGKLTDLSDPLVTFIRTVSPLPLHSLSQRMLCQRGCHSWGC